MNTEPDRNRDGIVVQLDLWQEPSVFSCRSCGRALSSAKSQARGYCWKCSPERKQTMKHRKAMRALKRTNPH